MDTEKAIEFLENSTIMRVDGLIPEEGENTSRKVNGIIRLLRQGEENEKYKKMWECLTKETTRIFITREHDYNYRINGKTDVESFNELAISIKQKYFPPIKKTVTIKFETEDKDVVNCCVRIIKERLEEYSDSIHIDYKIEEG